MYNVKDYGVVGNSTTDDTAAIQALITLVSGLGGGVLYFPPGTYLLSIGAGGYALEPKPRVSLRGEYATFKLANGQGNYKALFYNHWTPVVSVDDVTIEGITFDMNTANNPITYADGAAWIADAKPRAAIWIHRGKRLTIRNCRFINTDSINLVFANGNGLGADAVQSVRVLDNEFEAYGVSPIVHDHSSVYIHGEAYRISGNTVRGHSGNGCVTAIETHGRNVTVFGNNITGMATGVIVTSPNTIICTNVLDVPSPVVPAPVDAVLVGLVVGMNTP